MTLPSEQPEATKIKKLLIITSSGGGGHNQAARAKALEMLDLDPSIEIIQRDILLDWMGKPIGNFFTGLWNNAQMKGKFQRLHFFIRIQPLYEVLFWIPIFLYSLKTLLKEDIDRIIDTQPIATSPIIKAIKCVKHLKQKKLILERIVTELPTSKAAHFFRPIRQLSKNDRSLIKLITTHPLAEKKESDSSFWQQHCRLPKEAVSYADFPLRPRFKEYQNRKRQPGEFFSLQIKYNHLEELDMMKKSLARGCINASFSSSYIQISLPPEDLVFSLMLGSHPAKTAILNYVKNFIELFSSKLTDKKKHLFVFCHNHFPNKETLFKKVYKLILSAPLIPPNFSIIPLPFQDDDIIAPLFFRSDATITRSGGLTSMELMAVSTGQIWIHSEADLTKEELKKHNLQRKLMGMPPWEWGNALYLRIKKGAKMITPDTFPEIFLA